jgi:hypothetical protein
MLDGDEKSEALLGEGGVSELQENGCLLIIFLRIYLLLRKFLAFSDGEGEVEAAAEGVQD